MINGKIIKVCGMREAQNIRDVESLQRVDMMGFIFYPKSPRYIYELPAYLPVHARRVGVFVNEDKDVITMYADRFGLEYIQPVSYTHREVYKRQGFKSLFVTKTV